MKAAEQCLDNLFCYLNCPPVQPPVQRMNSSGMVPSQPTTAVSWRSFDPSWKPTDFTEQSTIPSRRTGSDHGLQAHCELAASLLKTANNSLSPFYTSQPLEKKKFKMLLELSSLSAILGKKMQLLFPTHCMQTHKQNGLLYSCWHFTFLFLLYLQRSQSIGKWHFRQLRKLKYIEKW